MRNDGRRGADNISAGETWKAGKKVKRGKYAVSDGTVVEFVKNGGEMMVK